ncbi:MAG TPA: hypothetical protein DCM10_03970 [Xanthomarina gelatinilytica]|nr:hypothetical protein [Xanthomarina gelatinilytica]|tara:strand:+ start:1125 stop:1793 length:669 start_codon:yes stop_codon:yes gene_type:complete
MPRKFTDTEIAFVSLRTRYAALDFIGQVCSFDGRDDYTVRFLLPLCQNSRYSYWGDMSFPNCDYYVKCKTHELSKFYLLREILRAKTVVQTIFMNKVQTVKTHLCPKVATDTQMKLSEDDLVHESDYRNSSYYSRYNSSHRKGNFMIRNHFYNDAQSKGFYKSLAYLSFSLMRIDNIINQLSDNKIDYTARYDYQFLKHNKLSSLTNFFPTETTTITRRDYV